jgi:hypothetical protein
MANREVLPADCPLPPNEKNVINNTAFDGEMPCFGCPSRYGCPARIDLELATALKLMEEKAPPTRTCRRCGGFITEWSVRGNFRNFECSGTIKPENQWSDPIPCHWRLSELGDKLYLT